MTCSGAHRDRLFIGEAGFKGVWSLVEKHAQTHPNLGQSIVATELATFNRTSENCPSCDQQERAEMQLAAMIANLFLNEGEQPVDYTQDDLPHTSFCSDRCERIQKLKNKGVTIILGFDGTQIHTSQHPSIIGKRFTRIQWNCPHNRSNFKAQTLPPLINSFFASATQVQQAGDRIHVTLAQPNNKSEFYQGYVYNIRQAANSNGYVLFAKRAFGSQRYPGYDHEITGLEASAGGAERQREFVFAKRPMAWPDERTKSKFASNSYYGSIRQYYIRDTDNESSSYSSSDQED